MTAFFFLRSNFLCTRGSFGFWLRRWGCWCWSWYCSGRGLHCVFGDVGAYFGATLDGVLVRSLVRVLSLDSPRPGPFVMGDGRPFPELRGQFKMLKVTLHRPPKRGGLPPRASRRAYVRGENLSGGSRFWSPYYPSDEPENLRGEEREEHG